MKNISTVMLTICLAATGGIALAEDSMSMDKGTMSKDTMKKDTMTREAMSKDPMDKQKSMHKEHMHKDSMKKDSMDTKETMGKDKGMQPGIGVAMMDMALFVVSIPTFGANICCTMH